MESGTGACAAMIPIQVARTHDEYECTDTILFRLVLVR